MFTSPWRQWFRRPARSAAALPVRRRADARLRVEALEGRDVPSSVTYGGSTSAAVQTYNHPDATGTALSGQVVPVQALAFRVSALDTYTLTNTASTFSGTVAGDGFFALYRSSFDPSHPLNNLIAVNDDGGGALGARPQIAAQLDPAFTYMLVTSPAQAGSTGDFINQLSGPGADTFTFNTHMMPAVDTPTATGVGSTAATLGGTVEGDGGTPVTERGIVYSLAGVNGAPTIGGAGVTKVAVGSGTGTFTTNVTGLSAGNAYAFRAYATNAVGTFYTSPVSGFAANVAPILGGIKTAPQAVNDNATVQPFPGVTITDADAPPETETVTVAYLGANGTFTNLGGFTGSAGTYTFAGTPAAAQAAVRGLTFVPTPNQVAPGLTVTTTFTVTVTDGFATVSDGQTTVVATSINDAPALTPGSPALPGILSTVSSAANTGQLVSALVSGRIADPDAGAVPGIAVTATTAGGGGTWQYATNGTTWVNVPAGASAATPLLLNADADTRVRFVPSADATSTPSITYRAWDRTAGGAEGGLSGVNPNGGGGATAFSTATDTATVAVTDGLPPTAAVQVSDGSAQRSVIRSLTVAFSEPVAFAGGNAAAAFTLTRTGPTGPTGSVPLTPTVTTDGQGRTVVTLTFSGQMTEANTAAGANPSLIDGLYTLTVSGSAVTGTNGFGFDGDGNGAPGGDKVMTFHRLFGDYNGDRVVDPADIFPALQNAIFTSAGQPGYQPAFDFDGNGVVDPADLFPNLQNRLFTSI